jgi:hypothetical protein
MRKLRIRVHASRAPERQRERSPILVWPVNLRKGLRDPALAALGRWAVKGPMKIAFLVLLGLILGVLGGAVLGVGAGLAWVEIFKTSNFEGYSGMLLFFGFMPGGAILGGLAGGIAFGVLTVRDREIAIERPPKPARKP